MLPRYQHVIFFLQMSGITATESCIALVFIAVILWC